jgi:ribosome recycling factor
MSDINTIKKDADGRMRKAIESFEHQLGALRTGRAHPGLVENLEVDSYGSKMALKQVASISASDARTLTVTPWDKSMVAAIEKAIRDSDLGINPATAGAVIRLPMPPLTEERRKALVKTVNTEAENAKVVVRSVRRDANNQLKDLLKSKTISEDEERRAQSEIQKATDKAIEQIEKIAEEKEKDLMTI